MSKIYIYIISLVFCLVLLSNDCFAISGVQHIIRENEKNSEEYWGEFSDFSEYESDHLDAIANQSNAIASPFIKISSGIKSLQSDIIKELGSADGNSLLILLFALAVFIQMSRVITGKSDWISFVVRVLIALIFINAYDSIYFGMEAYAFFVKKTILNGREAADILFTFNGGWYQQILDSNILTFNFVSNVLPLVGVLMSSLFAIVVGLLFSLLQTCALIVLYYIGPILIALAIIPDINYTSSFLSSLLQVLGWSIIYSMLVKILVTTVTLMPNGIMGTKEFVILMVINFTFAGSTLFIPSLSNMIFSGANLSAVGSSAMGVVYAGVIYTANKSRSVFRNSDQQNSQGYTRNQYTNSTSQNNMRSLNFSRSQEFIKDKKSKNENKMRDMNSFSPKE